MPQRWASKRFRITAYRPPCAKQNPWVGQAKPAKTCHANIRKWIISGNFHQSLGDVDLSLWRNKQVDVVSFHYKRFFKGIYAPLFSRRLGIGKGGAGRRSPVILWFNLYDVTLMVAMSYRALRWFGGEWSLVEPYWKEHGVGWKRHQGHLDKRLTYTTSCGNFPLSENHAKKFTTSSKLLLCLVLQLQGLLWRYVLERAPLLRSTAK